MSEDPSSTPSAHSSDVSTRSGYPPGTPKPPIDPPCRRSSLAFARLFPSPSCPQSTGSADAPVNQAPLPVHTPSNTGRKRAPRPAHTNVTMPGHVARMQKLFQSAKASLQFDVRFAASPTGSIGSRLPQEDNATSTAFVQNGVEGNVDTLPPAKDWRYSTAPPLLAGLDIDVREPFPEASPQLPRSRRWRSEHTCASGSEPSSSGFTSPADRYDVEASNELNLPAMPRLSSHMTPGSASVDDELRHTSLPLPVPTTDLEEPMTALRVCSDNESRMDIDDLPQSKPWKRTPVPETTGKKSSDVVDEEIFLSAPAKAAAESAKAKRGLLRGWLFHKPRDEPTAPITMPVNHGDVNLSNSLCPDPSLHQLDSLAKCPDPAVRNHVAGLSKTPVPPRLVTPIPHSNSSPLAAIPRPALLMAPTGPFQRASATGSPLPVVRLKSPPQSPGGYGLDPRYGYYSAHPGPHYTPYQTARPPTGRGHPRMANEHFQPGWYYARETPDNFGTQSLLSYSFSTAAAKVVGQSPAPDSRIRDSYRTDTLTPLAKPPHRFRKTGIGALAATRGMSRYYAENGPDQSPSSYGGHSNDRQPARMHRGFALSSDLPRGTANLSRRQSKRRRPKNLEDEPFEVRKDNSSDLERAASPPRLEDGDEVIAVDDETRAAVRMSLYGAVTPDVLRAEAQGIRELSPNVTPWRKGLRQPRKKRRPSYWDGDLEAVKTSSAARHVQLGPERQVATSPATEEARLIRTPGASHDENLSPTTEHAGGEVETSSSMKELKKEDASMQLDMELCGVDGERAKLKVGEESSISEIGCETENMDVHTADDSAT